MTITVHGKGGVIVHFPDGTDAATIEQVMQGKSGASAEPAEEYRGKILPFKSGPDGKWQFDPFGSGPVGTARDVGEVALEAAKAPGRVYRGELDPMSPEAIERMADTAMIFGPVNPAVRAGDKAIPGISRATQKAPVKAPSAQALKRTAGRQFDEARNLGVDYDPQAVRNMVAGARNQLEQDGILAELAPKTFAIIKKLEGPGDVAPLAGLDAARKSLRLAARDFTNPTEQLAASRLIRSLDDFVQNPPPAGVLAGPAATAGKLNKSARGNYAAAKRSEKLTTVEDQAGLRAKAANSGRNLDNAIRSKAVSILSSPKQAAGFSKEELALIREVAEGTATRNTLRYVGNLLGGGGGLGAAMTGSIGGIVGGTLGGPPGVAAGLGVPAIGAVAKSAANSLTRRALNTADEAVRQRSPLYSQRMKNAPMVTISPDRRAMIMRLLGLTPERPKAPQITTQDEYEAYLRAGGA